MFRSSCSLVLVACLLSCRGGGTEDFQESQSCLEDVLSQNAASGGAFAVFDREKTLHVATLGTLAPQSELSIRPTTRFRFGSVLKMMTATALMRLADRGALETTSNLSTLLPTLAPDPEPSWTQSTTIHHLLTHQAGFLDYLGGSLIELIQSGGNISDYYYGPIQDAALRDTLLSVEFRSLVPYLLEPGTRYNYSNSNYRLAGLVLEDKAGEFYPNAMASQVFEPLGMTRSAVSSSAIAGDTDVASGVTAAGVVGPGAYDNAWARPAGFAWGSIVDLAQFARFILAGNTSYLSNVNLAHVITPHVSTNSPDGISSYGYGVFVRDGIVTNDGAGYIPVKTLEHSGGVLGYSAWLRILPDHGVGVVALANGDGLGAALERCGDQALFALVDRPSVIPIVPNTVGSSISEYKGNYFEPQLLGAFVITEGVGEALTVKWAGGINALTPTTLDTFALDLGLGPPLRVNGIRDPITGSVQRIYSRFFVAERTL